MAKDDIDVETRDSESYVGPDADDLAIIAEAENDAEKVVTRSLPRPHQLGYISVMCIIINKMIGKNPTRYKSCKPCNQANKNSSVCEGTGIFDTASIIAYDTRSVGFTLIFWVLGGIAALAGTLCFIE